MHTRVLVADISNIQAAVEAFAKNNPVVVPTETVYGLAAPITNPEAVEQIYAIKGRPSDNPLIVHITTFDQLHELTEQLPEYAEYLFETFWPGPLTVVCKTKQSVKHITGPQGTIAVRMPAHPFIQALINQTGPLAAPSANLSGKPSPTTAEHCVSDLNGKVEIVFDGGEVFHGVESTVLDLTEERPVILRPGVITQDMLEDVIKQPCIVRKQESLKSPGTRYAHYQPDARVILSNQPETIDPEDLGRIIVVSDEKPPYECEHIAFPDNAAEIAHNVYAWLRRADTEGFDTIVIKNVADVGIGAAVMDRLRRAAKHS